jgi:hypothetical protein
MYTLCDPSLHGRVKGVHRKLSQVLVHRISRLEAFAERQSIQSIYGTGLTRQRVTRSLREHITLFEQHECR